LMRAAIRLPRSPASRSAKGSLNRASDRPDSQARYMATHRAVSDTLETSGWFTVGTVAWIASAGYACRVTKAPARVHGCLRSAVLPVGLPTGAIEPTIVYPAKRDVT